jgi:voltage-gated potassium channel Kch
VSDQLAIIGLGKVGFVYARFLAKRGYDVIGLDADRNVQARIAAEFGDASVATSFADLADCRSVHICVPTDPAADGAADLSILEDVVMQLQALFQGTPGPPPLVSQRSTSSRRISTMGSIPRSSARRPSNMTPSTPSESHTAGRRTFVLIWPRYTGTWSPLHL